MDVSEGVLGVGETAAPAACRVATRRACEDAGGMGGPGGGGWPREAPALLSTALLLGGSLPERPPAPLFTIDSILAPRPQPAIPPLQLHHLAHTPFHRAHDLFGTSAKMFMINGETMMMMLLFLNIYLIPFINNLVRAGRVLNYISLPMYH